MKVPQPGLVLQGVLNQMDVPQVLVMVVPLHPETAAAAAVQPVMEVMLAQEQVRVVMVVQATLVASLAPQLSSVAVAAAVPRIMRLLHQVMVKVAVVAAVNQVPMVLERMA